MKTKLVKPEKLDEILDNSLILKSRQKYMQLALRGVSRSIDSKMIAAIMRGICAARKREDITEGLYRYDLCNNLRSVFSYLFCTQCFLNANNYLNILKYIKHRNDGKAKKTKENQ